MQSIFLFAVYCSFFVIATQAPFILALGYVWIDLFRPQIVNPGIMGLFPLSMIMGLATIVGYLAGDRRDMPRFNAVMVLLVVFATWMVLNTYLIAVLPNDAAGKFDWAFKTVVFSLFIPFIFRSRIQIEALILVSLAASAGNAIAFAAKMVIGGSFYGQALGLARADSGFGESSTFSMICAALIPLVLYSMRQSVIIPQFPGRRWVHIAACFGLVMALLGTHARTGLVALLALAILLWLDSPNKMVFIGLGAGAVLFVFPLLIPFVGDDWLARMDTILHPTTESSAMGRIAVWQWTWQYVQQHPLGGGFEVYRLSSFTTLNGAGVPFTIAGKAFHSIYFESLGELGFPGFFMLMGLFVLTFINLQRLRWQTRSNPDLAWMHDLAKTLTYSLIVYLAGGAFVGVAFQPLHYMWITLTVALQSHLYRYQLAEGIAHSAGPSAGWSRHVRPDRALSGGGVPAGARVGR